jgi:hypothetical protein
VTARRLAVLRRLAVPGVVLPMLLGAGACGIVLVDIAQRDLILEPVERVDFEVGGGNVEVYAFNRNGISLYYYMYGSLRDIGDVGYELTDDDEALEVFSVCDRTVLCTVNWYAEVPLGTAIDVQTHGGGVKLTGVDAEIAVDVAGGGFEGVGLRADALDLVVESGDVVVELLEPPTSVLVTVGAGNVELTLPPGTYRCDLTASDGVVDTTDVVCDPMATALIEIGVDLGDITLLQGPPP